MFVGNKLLGVDPDRTSTDQEHELGTIVIGDAGEVLRYVSAAEAIAAGDAVDYTSAYAASVTDAADYFFGIARVAIAASSYGWIQEKGIVSAAVTTSLAAGASIARDTAVGGDLNVVTAGDGVEVPAAVSLSAESGGLATVILF
jgi:hypothetical protein